MIKDGWTPLHLAAQEGHADVAELLIRKGARLSCENKVLPIAAFLNMKKCLLRITLYACASRYLLNCSILIGYDARQMTELKKYFHVAM